MLPKKPEKTVIIGIATAKDIKNELIYQILIFFINITYITLIFNFKKLTLVHGKLLLTIRIILIYLKINRAHKT